MDAAPTLVLLARLLVMGPEGTQALSEQRASIPQGATGVLQEKIGEARFPSVLRVYVTPGTPAAPPEGKEEPQVSLALRCELWRDPDGPASGAPPDEVNLEQVVLSPSGAALVQIAEDPEGDRRLLLSLSTLTWEGSPPPAPLQSEGTPRPIAFRIETFRDLGGGAREMLAQHVLLTLERRSVSWETTLRFPRDAARRGATPEEIEKGVKLTLTPGSLSGGWISVESRLEAKIVSAEPSGTGPPTEVVSSASRIVPLGIPFEISSTPPADPSAAGPDTAPRVDRYLVEVTPFTPQAP